MISIPIAVHTPHFKWQLDLFWHAHKKIYGEEAYKKAFAVIVKYNHIGDKKIEELEWNTDIPHQMCDSFHDILNINANASGYKPINIQVGLQQILNRFDENKVIEVLDCDLFHITPHPNIEVDDNELYVCDLYENWHLKSLTDNKNKIERYFKNKGDYYNGGFVPIIGKVKTFRKILLDWTSIHLDIMKNRKIKIKRWWIGMYSLQAACERNKIKMKGIDTCFIPPVNKLKNEHYICHYSVDPMFQKHIFPNINIDIFNDNLYHNMILDFIKNNNLYPIDADN